MKNLLLFLCPPILALASVGECCLDLSEAWDYEARNDLENAIHFCTTCLEKEGKSNKDRMHLYFARAHFKKEFGDEEGFVKDMQEGYRIISIDEECLKEFHNTYLFFK